MSRSIVMFSYNYSISERSSTDSNDFYSTMLEAWNASRGKGWYGSNGSLQIVEFDLNEKDLPVKIKRKNINVEYYPQFKCFADEYGKTDVMKAQQICKELGIKDENDFVYVDKGMIFIVEPKFQRIKRVHNYLNEFDTSLNGAIGTVETLSKVNEFVICPCCMKEIIIRRD